MITTPFKPLLRLTYLHRPPLRRPGIPQPLHKQPLHKVTPLFPNRPPRINKIQSPITLKHRSVNRPLSRIHPFDPPQKFPPSTRGVRIAGGSTEDEHAVGFVAVGGVGCGDVDVPASLQTMEFGGPEIAAVVRVGFWTPDCVFGG